MPSVQHKTPWYQGERKSSCVRGARGSPAPWPHPVLPGCNFVRPYWGGMLAPLSWACMKCGQKLQTGHEKFLQLHGLQELCRLSCCGHAAVGSWSAAGTPARSIPHTAPHSHFGRDFLSTVAPPWFPAQEPSVTPPSKLENLWRKGQGGKIG